MKSTSSIWFSMSVAMLVLLLAVCIVVLSLLFVFGSSISPSITTLLPYSNPLPADSQPTLPPTPKIKCTNSNCADACLSKLTAFLQPNSVPESLPKSAFQHGQGFNPVLLVTYPVNGDQLGSPQFSSNVPPNLITLQQDISPQEKVWNYFVTIIPADQRQQLVDFLISTDGKGNTLASVEQSVDQPQYWGLNVDIADSGQPRDLTFNLVHEFGHLLTLNDSQVTPDQAFLTHAHDLQIYQQEAANCPQYFTLNGCTKSNSYLNKFFDQFWPKIFDEWKTVNVEKDQNNYSSLLAKFYEKHSTQFNSLYSATSPEEDIAESWSYFVLTPRPPDDSIAHEKLLFFYNFPELVDLRSRIENGICNYTTNQ